MNNDYRWKECCHSKCILVFVEKCGPRDIFVSDLPPLVESFLRAILAFYQRNIFKTTPYSDGEGIGSIYNNDCRICSSISGGMANEFFAQLNR